MVCREIVICAPRDPEIAVPAIAAGELVLPNNESHIRRGTPRWMVTPAAVGDVGPLEEDARIADSPLHALLAFALIVCPKGVRKPRLNPLWIQTSNSPDEDVKSGFQHPLRFHSINGRWGLSTWHGYVVRT